MARIRVEDACDAIRKHKGNISASADSLGCSRRALYDLAERSPRVAAVLAESRARLIDDAETVVADKIEAGDLGAARFVLQTIGKDRGYVERTEQEQSGKVVIEIHRADEDD